MMLMIAAFLAVALYGCYQTRQLRNCEEVHHDCKESN